MHWTLGRLLEANWNYGDIQSLSQNRDNRGATPAHARFWDCLRKRRAHLAMIVA